MSSPAVSSVHQALQKSFKNLENCQKVWKSALTECSPLLESLGNLAEQSKALSNVQLSDTPLRVFPDLEDRLRFKLLQAMDTVLGKLNDKLSSLQSVRDTISSHASGVLQLYELHTDSLDLLAVTERSATTPSIADMLGWLQDAERHYRQQFLRRKALLQMLRADNLSLVESAPQRWESLESASAEDCITDILCKVSFFMESELGK
ncbi:AFG2-interacting ribosome maturation factor [Solea solea]|uniref:AFG2-interacting ribosome maturation factor n=1 Tax=Solea solea TaxID=90069 RepID=UPI00272A2526|nr:AFG2-interacting ribosome maturation factor [Solea solea]